MGEPTGKLWSAAAAGETRRQRSPTRADRALLPVLLIGLAWLVWYCGRLIVADFQVMEARSLVRAWADGTSTWTVPRWVFARDATLAAIATTPANPSLYDQMGVIYLIRARDAWRSEVAQRELYREAARYQRLSLALRPGHGWTWAALAESLQDIEPGSDDAWHAWRQALKFTPHELPVQSSLFRIGFSEWAKAPPDVKAWMRATYEGARAGQRAQIDRIAAQFKVTKWQ